MEVEKSVFFLGKFNSISIFHSLHLSHFFIFIFSFLFQLLSLLFFALSHSLSFSFSFSFSFIHSFIHSFFLSFAFFRFHSFILSHSFSLSLPANNVETGRSHKMDCPIPFSSRVFQIKQRCSGCFSGLRSS